jgi:metal-responsive CopG/Arc/MetJ family transcriptional regulator
MTGITETTGKRSKDFGVTLPSKTLEKLDEIRGDIPRSRYLLRLVERALQEQEEKLRQQPRRSIEQSK